MTAERKDYALMAVSFNHGIYYSIARKNLESMEKALKRFPSERLSIIRRDLIRFHKRHYLVREHGFTSIVFSALTAEAFINLYAIERFDSNYYNNFLDALPVKAKWKLIPKLATGAAIDSKSRATDALNRLVESRNKLVHYKFKPMDIKQAVNEERRIRDAASSGVKCIQLLSHELKLLDPSVDVTWVNW